MGQQQILTDDFAEIEKMRGHSMDKATSSENQSLEHSSESRVRLTDSQILSSVLNLPFVTKQICNHFVRYDELFDRIHRSFPSFQDAHGAISTKVLVWGAEGNGKRQLATQFAKEFASANNRQILWIEGKHATTFVRDYCLAYQLIVGEPVTKGPNLPWLMYNIQQTLNQCMEKWFMVVFDLDAALVTGPPNETGIPLTQYLPNGQVLITRSYRTTLITRESAMATVCKDLPLDGVLTYVHLHSMTGEASFEYFSRSNTAKVSTDDWPMELLGTKNKHALTLTLACSTARLCRLSLGKFSKMLNARRAIFARGQNDVTLTAYRYGSFACTMELLLESLQDTSRDAELLLSAILCISERDVPVRLVSKLDLFLDRTQDLEEAIHLLHSMSVIDVRTLDNGERFIDMHKMIYGWLDERERQIFWDGDRDCKVIVENWIRILDDELPEFEEAGENHIYWLLLRPILSVFDISRATDVRSKHLMMLLLKISMFLSSYLIMPLATEGMLLRAQTLCFMLRCEDPDLDIYQQRIQLHRERSRLLALLGNHFTAQLELSHAKLLLTSCTHWNLPDNRNVLEDAIFDEEITQLLGRTDMQEVRQRVEDVLSRHSHSLSSKRRAQLHYWIACSIVSQSDGSLTALLHSHLTMAYWTTLTEHERWGKSHFALLAWVETHAGILMQMKKSRGALVFLPQILNCNIERRPPHHENIWRLAYYTVREYTNILEYDAAELVANKVLRLCDPTTLRDISLSWAISMLHALGTGFFRVGRFMEAEGVLRWCLVAVKESRPPSILTTGPYVCDGLWVELVFTLLVQKKAKAAQAARDLSIEWGIPNLEDEDWKSRVLEPYHDRRQEYESVLQIARDRLADINNPDDERLNNDRYPFLKSAVILFGDPFERIIDGNEDISADIHPSQRHDIYESQILDHLGYVDELPPSGKFEKQSDHEDLKWNRVFECDLMIYEFEEQSRLWNYWRWCDCRRKRKRSGSLNMNVPVNRRTLQKDSTPNSVDGKCTERPLRQSLILEYFVRERAVCCLEGCPCIRANADGKLLTSQLEAERLFIYQSPDPSYSDERNRLYQLDIADYRRFFGPRPAFAHGLNIYEDRKIGTVESGVHYNTLNHEIVFWTPDFTVRGDAESNTEFYGQEENHILINPAVVTVLQTDPVPMLRLPKIVITSYDAGEEVLGNVNRWTSNWRKDWEQTSIRKFFSKRQKRRPVPSDSFSDCEVAASRSRRNIIRSRRSSIGHSDSEQSASKSRIYRHRSLSPRLRDHAASRSCSRRPRLRIRGNQVRSKADARSSCGSDSITRRDSDLPRGRNRSQAQTREASPYELVANYKHGQSRHRRSPSLSHSSFSETSRASSLELKKPEKINIFSLQSLHINGPIFNPGQFNGRRLQRWSEWSGRSHPGVDENENECPPSSSPRVRSSRARIASRSRTPYRKRRHSQ